MVRQKGKNDTAHIKRGEKSQKDFQQAEEGRVGKKALSEKKGGLMG